MNEQRSVREKISLADVVPYFFGLNKDDFESLSLVSKAVRNALRDIVVRVDVSKASVYLRSTKKCPWDLPLRCISFSSSVRRATLDSIDVRKVSFSHSMKCLQLDDVHDLRIDDFHSLESLVIFRCSRFDLSQLVSSSVLVVLDLYNVEVVATRTLDVPPTLQTLRLIEVHGLEVQKLHLLNSRLSELSLVDSTGVKINTIPVDIQKVTIRNSTGKIVHSSDSIETSCLATQFLFYGRSLSCTLIELLPTNDDRNAQFWADQAARDFLSPRPEPPILITLQNVPVKKLELEAYGVSLLDSKDIKEVTCCLSGCVRLIDLKNLQILSFVSTSEMPLVNLTLESLPLLTTVDIPSETDNIFVRNVGLETMVIPRNLVSLEIADMQQLQSITFNGGLHYTRYDFRNCPKLVEVVALGHAHVPEEILEFANTQAQGNQAAPIQNFDGSMARRESMMARRERY